MIAEGCKIIADFVHDVDQIGACRQQADWRTLHRVAAVNKRDKVVRLFHVSLVCRDTGKAKTIVHAAVNIIGVQDHNVVGFFVGCEYRGHQTKQHAHSQKKCNKFLHNFLLVNLLCRKAKAVYCNYTTNCRGQLLADV